MAEFDPTTARPETTGFDPTTAVPEEPPKARGFKGWAGDALGVAARGAISVPEAVVGLADIPTGGAVGKFLENQDGSFGFRPKQAKEAASEYFDSEATKQQNQQFQNADGIVDKAKVVLQNPSMIARAVGESLPSMGAGGVAARGALAATRLGQMGAQGAALAGAIGEGVVGAGSQAEQIRQETPDGNLTPTQAGLAALTGAATTGFSALGGRIANKLGIGDAETMLAQGTKGMARQNADDAVRAAANPLIQQQAAKSIPRQVIEGAISEGFLEELPQSVAEQIFQNLALGQDWLKDVDGAAVMGVLTGGAMGAGAAGYHGATRPTTTDADVQRTTDARVAGEKAAAAEESAGLARMRQAFNDQLNAASKTAPVLDETALQAAGVPRALPKPVLNTAQLDRGLADLPPSVRMGLDPATGTLSAAAAMAVDAGVTARMEQDAAAQAKQQQDGQRATQEEAEATERAASMEKAAAAGRKSAVEGQRRIDMTTGELLEPDTIKNWTDEQLANTFRGAQSKTVRMAMAQELSRRRTEALQRELTDEQNAPEPIAPGLDAGFARITEDAGPLTAEGTDGSTTPTNAGAQAAPARPAQSPAQAPAAGTGNADAGAAWTRTTTVEREALLARAEGLKPIQRKMLKRVAWADMNGSIQKALAAAMESPSNQAPALAEQASAAIKTEAPTADGKPRTITDKQGDSYSLTMKAEAFGAGNTKPNSLMVEVRDPATGDRRGFVDFAILPDGTIQAENAKVAPQFRRRGLSDAMYRAASEAGYTIVPGRVQTEDGAGMLKAMQARGVVKGPISNQTLPPALNQQAQAATETVAPSKTPAGTAVRFTQPPTEKTKRGTTYTGTVAEKDGKQFVVLDQSSPSFAGGVREMPYRPGGGWEVAGQAADATSAPGAIVEHVTGRGKTLRGVVRTDLTQEQAKAIDEYTFKKDDGWFIREKYLENQAPALTSKAPEATKSIAKPKAAPAPAPEAPVTRINGEVERAAADRLELLHEKMMGAITNRNSREGNAKASVRSVIEELRKPRTVVSIVPVLETASTALTQQYGAFADVIDSVIDSLNGVSADISAAPAPRPAPAPAARRIQPGEPGYTLLNARNDLMELRTQEANQGRITDDRLGQQIRQMEKLVGDMERAQEPAAKGETENSRTGVVNVPPAIETALDADMQAQKARITRLRNAAAADGQTLEQKKAAQTQLKGAEFSLQTMRRTRFDAEDAALKAIEQKDMAPFAEHITFFKTEKVLQALVSQAEAEGQSTSPAVNDFLAGRRDDAPTVDEVKAEAPARDAAGNVIQRPLLTGADRYQQGASMRGASGALLVAQARVLEYMNGELDRPTLMQALEDSGLPEGVLLSITQRMQEDSPSNGEIDAMMARRAQKTAATPKKPKVNPAQARAKADLMAALADLGDILGKNTRMNIVPEQEQKLLPVLTRLLDAAFRLGYHKFKDSAKFALDQIRANLGDEAADALTLDHLQGAYIGMAGGKKGADTKRAVIDVETKAEIESHEAEQEQDDGEPTARPVDGAGVPALAGEQPSDGGAAAQVGPAADAATASGGGDGQADANPAGRGTVAPGSVGGSPAEPVPATGARGRRANGTGRGSRAVRGDATNAGERADARGEGAVGSNPAPNAPAPQAPQFTPTDFTITEDFALGEGGEKTKYQANVAAIRLLQELDAAGRMATPEEQAVLARYVGWGGLANAFEGGNPAWAREQAELKALLSPEDYAAAARSTRYAHYTSREIVQDGIYAALKRFGFTGGKVLEGGGGVGNFIGLMPESMRAAGRVTAVEREPIAAGIAKHLYPQQNMVQEDFTRFAGTDDYYDAAVGNPPFASDPQTDQSNRKHLNGLSLHNYFFAKEVDMLREGGILAQVVTNSFLDSKGDTARRYISDRTKFLGAIRLPNNAFSKNAGTEVTTDLIFLQKRPESEWGGRAARAEAKAWLDIGAYQDKNGRTVALNQYFIDNPSMMLGDFGAFGTMYRANMTALVAREGQDTAALLKEAVARLPEGIYQSAAVQGTEKQVNAAIMALRNPPVTEGGFFEQDGKLIRREADLGGEARGTVITPETQWTEKTKLGEAGFARIQGMSRMRTTLRSLIAAEMSNDDANMGKLRAELNQQYDDFTKANGLINDPANARVFDDDPDYPLLASLEHGYTPAIGLAAAKAAGIKPVKSTAKKATIFARRVVAERKAVTKVESPADALAVSMAERGRLDTSYIGQLLGKDPEDALHELTTGEKPLLFKDPATREFVLRDAYLSGNVRAKLQIAKDAGMFANVKALEAVQPADVGGHEIVARVGSPWVPESVYEDFAKEMFGEGTTASVRYTKANSSYGVYVKPGNSVANTNTWGTPSYSGTELLAALLNNRQIKVLRDGPNKTRVVDVDATEAANIKAQDIRNKFSDWLFADGDRSELLVRAYNDTNNNYVVREYDGSFMQFPGKVPDDVIRFRRHQRNAISRIVQDRTALLDHEVGAGKTFTVIAGMMELKRTGLANKPMVAVPNHLVKQWAADWYRLYPGANILTATKKDFEKNNRRRFLAKIATGDWDAVIIAHSSFGFIKPSPEFEAQFNQKQIALVVEAIKSVDAGDGDEKAKKRTVKQLEGLKERLENRIKGLRDKPMDALLDFEQLGVDQLAVDEAHMFKNLMFSTKLQNVQGLGDSAGSQRAYDLFVKANQLYAKNGRGQGVVFATGTPVSNSLAEMYHMMRYLMPAQMEELGFQSFDAWANTFASVEQVWMQKPSGDGFKASNRMSNFVNTPELLHMFDQVSDTVTMTDIKRAYSEENDGKEFPIPPLKTGRRQPVSLKKSPSQEAYMEVLAERARAVEERKGPPKKGEDNVLVIMSDGRKAAMDIRLVDLDATQREPGGRIDQAVNNAMERYEKFKAVKGTQLFFSDMGTPLKHAKNELKEYEALQARVDAADEDTRAMAALGNESAQDRVDDSDAAQAELDAKGPDWLDAVKSAMRGFSIYDDLKAALMERGVPENEIAFIHDYNTDEQKASLFRKVNAGDVRFVVGSTAKMGAGTNVQERLVALHHLDVPWRPSDIEQREGRIIRQGNALLNQIPDFEVEVLAYVTQDTLDMRMWQVQETKLKMINQLRSRQIAREIDNAFEEMEMSASEMQAAATGNPDLLTEIQLKADVKRLENRKRSFDAQQSDLQSRIKRNKRDLSELPAKIKQSRGAAAKAQAYQDSLAGRYDGWKATIDGKEYTSPTEAGDYLQELLKAAREPATEDGKEGKALPIRVVLNGEPFTSRTNLGNAFKELTGDRWPILWEVDGKRLIERSKIATAIRTNIADAVAEQAVKPIGMIGGFSVTVEPGRDRFNNLVLDIVATNGDDQMTGEITVGAMGRGGEADPAMVYMAGEKVIQKVEGMLEGAMSELRYNESQLERAKKTAKELEATPASGAWPDAGKLEDARKKHREILDRLAKAKKPAAAAAPAADTSDDFAAASGNRAGTPTDRAVMGLAQAGASTPDILTLIAGTSRNLNNRKLAQALVKAGINPEVEMGGELGGRGDGYRYIAKYSAKADAITMTPLAASHAEQVFLHEAVHAATVAALNRRGLASIQMNRLFQHVAKTGAADQQYGMTNVREFVAEAFSNPEFQATLKAMPAPRGSALRTAWDAFVRIVRDFLGLTTDPTPGNSVLDEVMRAGPALMRENALATGRGDAGADIAFAAAPDTEAFKRWFGDSKVVDADGKPLVVYHGTQRAFSVFAEEYIGDGADATSNMGDFGDGYYFTNSATAASGYAGNSEGSNVMPVYLSIKNPIDAGNLMDIEGVDGMLQDPYPGESLRNLLEQLGYDGIIVNGGEEIIAFRQSQIKSATGNRGTYDPDDADISYFGTKDMAALKTSALTQIDQAMNAPGQVSAWDKTVGTMRNLAERNPEFKPVFESAQQFIDDVAMLASDAADRGPRLMPRVDSWRDLRKKPVSAEDNKGVARPLFEGTLMWARDVDGKPVLVNDLTLKYAGLPAADKAQLLLRAGRIDPRVLRMWQGLPLEQFENLVNSSFNSKMLKAGVVWSEKELKELFGATDTQVSLYNEARASIDRSLDMTTRADMLRMLGKEYAGMRDAVLDLPTLGDARDLLTSTLQEQARENPEDADRLMDLNNSVVDRYAKTTTLMAEGYAPLSRFGRYTVDVVAKNGDREYFGMFETPDEANKMAQRMRAEFQDAAVTQGTMSEQSYKLFQGITPESLEQFGNMLGLQSTGDAAKDKAFQAYLQLTKNNQSALKRLIHRKGIAGYSEDVGRVLANFTYSNARLAAGALNAGRMETAIEAIPKEQGQLRDVAIGLREYISDPQEEGQAIRGMLFAQYLGGSIASAFVNTTQPFAVTMPWLSQFGGIRKAAGQMARAMKDMGTKGFRYEADLANALQHAEDDGVVSPQEIHQLMAQARGTGALSSGDGTKVGNARAAASNAWERTKVAWGQPFALAEQFNRRTTFIAAYRLAKDQKIPNPAGFARKAVLETQFLYSKANKPRWARGAVGGTLMTFKTYSISYLELLNRTWNAGAPGSPQRAAGRRAVAWSMVMLMLMGGGGGLPFVEDLEDLIDGIGQLMGYNVSSKQWRKKAIQDVVGKELGEFLDSGLSGLPGAPIDVSGRLGMGNLIPGTGLFLTKPNRDRDIMELVGPAGDLVSRGFTAGRKVLTGDVGGAALEIAPGAIRNAAKGVDMAASGIYKDTKGYKVIDTTLDEAVAKAIGFQPRSVAQVQESNSFMQRSKSFYTQTSSEIKAQWADALFNKDEAGVERARERLATWNKNNPDQPIVVKMPDVWKRVREMGKDRTNRIADTAPRALRQQMRDMAREG